jgi:hypothetical protein
MQGIRAKIAREMTIDEFRKIALEIPRLIELPHKNAAGLDSRYSAFWKNAFSKVD